MVAVQRISGVVPNRRVQKEDSKRFESVQPVLAQLLTRSWPLIGVTSELSVIYLALPYVRARKLYSIEMPNELNFAFDCTLLICVVAFGYLFGLPMVRRLRLLIFCLR